nr:MAG TPA: hypothetical protein [Caudoviricetes sp.]
MTDRDLDKLKNSATDYVKKIATVEDIVWLNKIFLEENPNAEYLRDIREVNDKEKED